MAGNDGITDAIIAEELDADREFDESPNVLDSTGEAIATAHLERSRLRRIASVPVRHLTKNWKEIVLSTGAGTGLAYAGTVSLSAQPDNVAVAKTAMLSYLLWKMGNDGGAKLGFAIGHALNFGGRDRFREVKTEPAGRWAGRGGFVTLAFLGGVWGHNYLDFAKDVTVEAPQSIPSALVDTFTHYSNTRWDLVWELEDQASCLYQQQMGGPKCLEGPGSEAIEINVNMDVIPEEGPYTDYGVFGRTGDIVNNAVDGAKEWLNGDDAVPEPVQQ